MTAATTLDRACLVLAAEECQYHALTRLADEAADSGDPALEKGYRWLAERRLWPARRRTGNVRSGSTGYWYWAREPGVGYADSWQLPAWAWDRLVEEAAPDGETTPLTNTFDEVLESGARAVGKWLEAGRPER